MQNLLKFNFVLVFSVLTLNGIHTLFWCLADFEQVNAGCVQGNIKINKILLIEDIQPCGRGIFKKPEHDIESPADPTIDGAEEKTLFLQPLGCWKMHYPKPEKYSIINKSTTFSTVLTLKP